MLQFWANAENIFVCAGKKCLHVIQCILKPDLRNCHEQRQLVSLQFHLKFNYACNQFTSPYFMWSHRKIQRSSQTDIDTLLGVEVCEILQKNIKMKTKLLIHKAASLWPENGEDCTWLSTDLQCIVPLLPLWFILRHGTIRVGPGFIHLML